jgi:hypothetical protein
MRALLKNICLQVQPSLEDEYTFVDAIGTGSQAKVELYRKKINNNNFEKA